MQKLVLTEERSVTLPPGVYLRAFPSNEIRRMDNEPGGVVLTFVVDWHSLSGEAIDLPDVEKRLQMAMDAVKAALE